MCEQWYAANFLTESDELWLIIFFFFLVSNENVLFYSTGTEIKKLNLTSNKTTTQHYNLEVTAMTAAHGFLYWAGTVFGMEKIIKTSMTKANNVESHVICQTGINICRYFSTQVRRNDTSTLKLLIRFEQC